MLTVLCKLCLPRPGRPADLLHFQQDIEENIAIDRNILMFYVLLC